MFEKSKIDAKELTQIFNDVTANVTSTCLLAQDSVINIRSLAGNIKLVGCNIVNSNTSNSFCQATNDITSNIQNQVVNQIVAKLKKKKSGVAGVAGDNEDLKSEIETQVNNIITDSIYNNCVNSSNDVINILSLDDISCEDSSIENISNAMNVCLYSNVLSQAAINNLANTINDAMDLEEKGPLANALDDILSLGALGVLLILILVFAFVFVISVVLLTVGGVAIFVLPKMLRVL